jgi:hypothetical protein
MIVFHFMIIMLDNFILKVNLNRFLKNASIRTRCQILQNGLQVNEILIFLKMN